MRWPQDGSLRCTYFGATFRSKKTLVLAQNLENKGPEIFLPSRSMVLKVVTGKILETWELSLCLVACGSVSGTSEDGGRGFRLRRDWSDSQLGWFKAAPTVGLSKICCGKKPDYLQDNLRASILSQAREWEQEETGSGCGLVPETGIFSKNGRRWGDNWLRFRALRGPG